MAVKASKEEYKYEFRLPRLNDYNGDISKPWLITFYIWNIDLAKLERKRLTPKGATAQERYKDSRNLIKEISTWLKNGAYTVDKKKKVLPASPQAEEKKSTVFDYVSLFLKFTQNTKKRNTLRTYKSHLKRYTNFLIKYYPNFREVTEFSSQMAFEFFDHLLKTRREGGLELSNKTTKTSIGTMSIFFNFLMRRKIVKENPFTEMESLPIEIGKRVAFADTDRALIKKYLTETNPNPQLWLYLAIMYYTFLRPGEEVRNLKIGDIGEHYIRVRSDDAKNRKTQYVQISRGLEELIQEYKLRDYDPELYIFTLQGRPGLKCPGDRWFYLQHAKVLDALNLKNKNYSQYSWKDTGVIALYRATKDIKLIQRMCRHSSLEQTDKYLKSLGMFLESEILESFPAL
ncbi:tyrosine-type recombinase/integrase [Flectobacillus roseus]